jgi:hypothetical protein
MATQVLGLDRDEYAVQKSQRNLVVKGAYIMFQHLFGSDLGLYKDSPRKEHSAVLYIPMSETAAIAELKNQYVGSMLDFDPTVTGAVNSSADAEKALVAIGGEHQSKMTVQTLENGTEYLKMAVANNSVKYAHVDPVLWVDKDTNIFANICDATDELANSKLTNGTEVNVNITFSPYQKQVFINIHAVQWVSEGDPTMSTRVDTKSLIASAFGTPRPEAGGISTAPASGGGAPTPAPTNGFAAPAPAAPAPAPAPANGFGF